MGTISNKIPNQGYFYPIKPTLCVLNDFGSFIRDNAYELEFESSVYNEIDWLILAGSFQNAYQKGQSYARQIATDKHVIHAFSDNIEMLSHYIYDNMSFVEQPIGERNQLKEILMVPNNFDCRECLNRKYCVVSKGGFRELDAHDIDAEFIFDTSTMIGVFKGQGFELEHDGDLLWSPVKYSLPRLINSLI